MNKEPSGFPDHSAGAVEYTTASLQKKRSLPQQVTWIEH